MLTTPRFIGGLSQINAAVSAELNMGPSLPSYAAVVAILTLNPGHAPGFFVYGIAGSSAQLGSFSVRQGFPCISAIFKT